MELIKVPNRIELKDIFIDIHCFGKNPQGEGIVFAVRKNDYVIYSAIIDENIDKNFLTNEGIEKLDLICWSHPHDDHTEGLKEIIKNYTSPKTKIVVPNGISDFRKYMSKKCRSAYKPIKRINRRNSRKNGEYVEAHNYTVIEYTYVDINGKNLNIKINSLAPISSRINNIRNNKKCNLNELSVCLLISVNDVCFLFSSDIYNNIIKNMNIEMEKFKNIIYYKIPHHGSEKSDYLLDSIPLSDNNRVAVSTIYKNNGQDKTPNIELLNKYIEKGMKVYCTSESYMKNSEERYNFGIVSIRIQMENIIQEKDLKWDIRFTGEATEVKKIQEKSIFNI